MDVAFRMENTKSDTYLTQQEQLKILPFIPCHRNYSQSDYRKAVVTILHPSFPLCAARMSHGLFWPLFFSMALYNNTHAHTEKRQVTRGKLRDTPLESVAYLVWILVTVSSRVLS